MFMVLAVYGTYRLGGNLTGRIFFIWPPAGLQIGLLMLVPPRRLFSYALTCTVATGLASCWFFGAPFALKIGLSLVILAQTTSTVWVMRRERAWVSGQDDGLRVWGRFALHGLLLIPLAASVVSAGIFQLGDGGGDFVQTLRSWFISSVLGSAIFVPVFLRWRLGQIKAYAKNGKLKEMLVLAALFAVTAIVVMGQDRFVWLFAMVPLLVVIVFRTGIPGLALAMLILTTVGLWFVFRGASPFGHLPDDKYLMAQLYLLLGWVFFYLIGGLVHGRQRLHELSQAAKECEREQAERERRDSERRFRLLVEQAADDYFLHDDKGVFLDVNERACRSTGYSREELLTMTVTDISLNLTQEEKEEIWSKMPPGEAVTVYSRHRRKNGTTFPVEVRVACHLIDGKKLFLGMVRDISERLESEGAIRKLNEELEQRVAQRTEALGLSNERLQVALSASRVGIWELDFTRGSFIWDEQMHALYGIKPGDFDGNLSRWVSFIHAEDREGVLHAWKSTITAGSIFEREFRIYQPSGSMCYIHALAKVFRDADGVPLRAIGTNWDVSEHHRLNEELKAEKERLALATLASGVGIWEFDFASGLYRWDARMHEIHARSPHRFRAGVPAGEYGGTRKEFMAVMPPEDATAMDTQALLVAHGATTTECEYRMADAAGGWRHIRSLGRVLRDAQGAAVRMVGTDLDVTEERRAAETLRKAKDAAEAAEQAKSTFLATMSHEIRTPMNGVLGMSTLLADATLTPDQREMVSIIQRSGENLLLIINDILDFSKIEAGKLRLDLQPFNLRNVVEETVALLAPQAEKKRLELVCDIEPGLDVDLLGDAGRIQQIITNLAGNAVKFTEQGEVLVIVRRTEGSPGKTGVRVEICDTGIGISAEAQARLFHPFAQADGSITRRFGGTGLGLAISRQLADLMGGSLEVESRDGGGSLFRFEVALPCVESLRMAAAGRRPGAIRALIVDDNESSRRVLARQLTVLGVEADLAASAGEALEKLRDGEMRKACRMVLIDRHMPEVDGLALAKLIRSEAGLAHLPLILMGPPEIHLRGEAAATGIHAVLTKPARETQLERLVFQVLGGKAVAAKSTIRNPLNLNRLRLLVVEDNAVNQIVVRKMLEQEGHLIEVVGNGKLALERLAQQRFDAVLMDCHMPEMDGYEATRCIREGQVPGLDPHITIIALTASATPTDRSLCLSAGMSDFAAKPLNRDALADIFMRQGLLVNDLQR